MLGSAHNAKTIVLDKQDNLTMDEDTLARGEQGSWALTPALYVNQNLCLSLLQVAWKPEREGFFFQPRPTNQVQLTTQRPRKYRGSFCRYEVACRTSPLTSQLR